MILDAENLLSNDQSMAGWDEAAADISTNVIDLAGVAADMGPGEAIKLLIQITTTLTGDVTADGVIATVQTDTVENFASPTTVVAATLPATLDAGDAVHLHLPGSGLQRYLRISYQAGDAVTAGAVTAGIVVDFQRGFGN